MTRCQAKDPEIWCTVNTIPANQLPGDAVGPERALLAVRPLFPAEIAGDQADEFGELGSPGFRDEVFETRAHGFGIDRAR